MNAKAKNGQINHGNRIPKKVWRNEVVRAAVTIVVAYYTGSYASGLYESSAANAVLNGGTAFTVGGSISTTSALVAGGVGGFAGGFVVSGGNFEAGLKGAVRGLLFAGAGQVGGDGWDFSRIGAHAIAGCVSGEISGGDCGSGALAAVAGKVTTIATGGTSIASAMLAGGVASRVAGGSFANGAVTAAFGYLFNHLMHRDALAEMSATNEAVAQAPEAPLDATPEPMQLAANINPSGGCAGGGLNAALACGSGGGGSISVTRSGVALPADPKYAIPPGYVQNPYGRSGSYGEVVNGRFVERLRIDSATPAGMKGPNTSHYHLNGKGTHYSPAPGDKNPGFLP